MQDESIIERSNELIRSTHDRLMQNQICIRATLDCLRCTRACINQTLDTIRRTDEIIETYRPLETALAIDRQNLRQGTGPMELPRTSQGGTGRRPATPESADGLIGATD